jgi:hypothetical protein
MESSPLLPTVNYQLYRVILSMNLKAEMEPRTEKGFLTVTVANHLAAG